MRGRRMLHRVARGVGWDRVRSIEERVVALEDSVTENDVLIAHLVPQMDELEAALARVVEAREDAAPRRGEAR